LFNIGDMMESFIKNFGQIYFKKITLLSSNNHTRRVINLRLLGWIL
jgi:hypothetical protein